MRHAIFTGRASHASGAAFADRVSVAWETDAVGNRVTRQDRLGFAYRFAAFVLRPLMQVVTRRDWRGIDNLDVDSGMVLAANHLSWFDPIVISHVLWDNGRPPRFLAKDSLFKVPVVGWIMRNAGQIPVVRGTRDAAVAVEAAVEAAAAGECVIVYPEGTITKDPDLWPMAAKTGAARIALTAGVPVIPMAHWGAQEVMGPYRKEFKAFPRKTMHVLVGPPVDLDELRTGDEPSAEALHEATDRVMAAITDLLRRIRSEYQHESGTSREAA
jgi:1-acyl-sn-glycerol-3-phosphate acyltransferase